MVLKSSALPFISTSKGQLPVSRSQVFLLDTKGAAFVQMPQQAPAEFHVTAQLPLDFCKALLLGVEEQASLHMAKNLCGTAGGVEVGIGREFQLDEVSLHAVVLKSECVGEHFQHIPFLLAIVLAFFLLLSHLVRII